MIARRCTRAIAVWTASCALLLAQAKKPDKGTDRSVDKRIEQLLVDLGDEANHQRRYEAFQTLQRERWPAALPPLLELLPRCGVNGQGLGLSLLTSYPPDIGHPALRKLLDRKSPLLEAGAAAALFRSGETSILDHITQPLSRADVPAALKSAIVNRISGIREPRVVAAVRSLLVPGVDGMVLDAVLNSLLYAEDPEARTKLKDLMTSSGLEDRNRLRAAAFLLAQGDTAFADLVASELRSGGGNALSQLQHFLTKAGQLPDSLLPPLRELAEKGTVPHQVQTAIRLLAAQTGGKDIALFKQLLERRDPLIAKAALEALQKTGGALPADALRRLLASEDASMALAAAEGLRRADDESGLPRVLEFAKAGSNQRQEAIGVLGHFRRTSVVPVLIDGLLDPEPAVRNAAQTALSLLLPNLFPYRRFDFATTGYQANGTPAQRAEAVQKVRTWWESQHGK